jgi:ATP-dependent helicase/nuclease subunit A
VTIAQPPDWDAHAAEEQRFDRAEGERLLYVASTRAAEELIIGCAYNANSPSPWRSFHEWLQQHAPRLELPQPVRGERHELETPAVRIQETIAAVDAARATLGRPTYRVAPVSRRKLDIAAADETAPRSEAPDDAPEETAPDGRGTDWGSAVHDGLQYAAEGVTGGSLRAACRNRLVALQRPTGSDGEPTELEELLAVIAGVRASPFWRRAAGADRMLVEVPFALSVPAAEYATLLGLPSPSADDPVHELIDGRIDLAFHEAAGWVIVDYKSDAAGAAIPAALRARYAAQLRLYAAAWQRITGEAVAETALLFTADAVAWPATAGRS